MLTFLRDSGKFSERKARLFAVACSRRVWHLLTDPRSRKAVEVAEQFADGRVVEAALHLAESEALKVRSSAGRTAAAVAGEDITLETPWAYETRLGVGRLGSPRFGEPEKYEAEATLLRDILGSPFRARLTLPPSLLAWSDGLVVKMATAIYEERSFAAGTFDLTCLAVLADALEDAGYDDVALLDHLRGPALHVRGCWAIDHLTGRE
jgi:hypothetical protein